MLKHLIFFTLILFIQNISDDEKVYLKSVYDLVTQSKFNLIDNLKEEVNSLKETDKRLIRSLKDQIKSFGFQITDQDKLNIVINDTESNAKSFIKSLVVNINIRGNLGRDSSKLKHLSDLFSNQINYSNQWKKFDLLVCEKPKLSALLILTKKIDGKFVTIYFMSLNKITYIHKSFVLINKSINDNNPFNNIYDLTEYDYKSKLFKEIAKNDKIQLPHIKVLVKYYSIFSYYVIAKALNAKFILPFEE